MNFHNNSNVNTQTLALICMYIQELNSHYIHSHIIETKENKTYINCNIKTIKLYIYFKIIFNHIIIQYLCIYLNLLQHTHVCSLSLKLVKKMISTNFKMPTSKEGNENLIGMMILFIKLTTTTKLTMKLINILHDKTHSNVFDRLN